MDRGEIRWANLDEPKGSAPGFKHPVLIVQADTFNQSRINTVICIVITSNTRLADAPGNLFLPSKESGLPKDSVINVSKIITLDKQFLSKLVRKVRPSIMREVENSLKLVLDID